MDQQATRTVGSSYVLKWSTKEVDKAARVRDNQRRHREKVRNYISQLESRLAETQTKLQQAEVTIKLLTEELDTSMAAVQPITGREEAPNTTPKLDMRHSETTRQISPPSSVLPTCATMKHQKEHSDYVDGADVSRAPCCVNEQQFSQSVLADWADTSGADKRGPSDQVLLKKGASNPLLANSLATESLQYDAKAEVETYSEMLPPGTNGSTTRCRDAYMIITEQNFVGLEVSTIYSWLQPGFRRPAATQDGCRVDNQLLFALLDHISSSGIAVSFTV